MCDFVIVPGRRRRDASAIIADSLEKLSHLWKRLHSRGIFAFEKVGAEFRQLFTELAQFRRAQEFR